MLFTIIFHFLVNSVTPVSADNWICKEVASKRSGSTIMACGVGEGPTEDIARIEAMMSAKREFKEACALSSSCRGHAYDGQVKRNDCSPIGDKYKCYRAIDFEILDEPIKPDFVDDGALDAELEKLKEQFAEETRRQNELKKKENKISEIKSEKQKVQLLSQDDKEDWYLVFSAGLSRMSIQTDRSKKETYYLPVIDSGYTTSPYLNIAAYLPTKTTPFLIGGGVWGTSHTKNTSDGELFVLAGNLFGSLLYFPSGEAVAKGFYLGSDLTLSYLYLSGRPIDNMPKDKRLSSAFGFLFEPALGYMLPISTGTRVFLSFSYSINVVRDYGNYDFIRLGTGVFL